jgi:hypothetical protein
MTTMLDSRPATGTREQRMDKPQHLQALDMANETRRAIVAVKRRIRAVPDSRGSRREAARVLREQPSGAERMTVVALLTACRRVGRGRAVGVLREQRISELRRVGALTRRQRLALADALEAL